VTGNGQRVSKYLGTGAANAKSKIHALDMLNKKPF
jgi:hypothetical protein